MVTDEDFAKDFARLVRAIERMSDIMVETARVNSNALHSLSADGIHILDKKKVVRNTSTRRALANRVNYAEAIISMLATQPEGMTRGEIAKAMSKISLSQARYIENATDKSMLVATVKSGAVLKVPLEEGKFINSWTGVRHPKYRYFHRERYLQWFGALPEDEQKRLVDLAVKDKEVQEKTEEWRQGWKNGTYDAKKELIRTKTREAHAKRKQKKLEEQQKKEQP